MEVTNPTMVVIVEQLWATKTGDVNDPNPMMLVDNQENCAILGHFNWRATDGDIRDGPTNKLLS